MKLPRTEDFEGVFNDPLWSEIARFTCRKHGLSFDVVERAAQGESVIFLVDERYVVKIYNPRRNGLSREKRALEIARTSLQIPEIVAFGELENYKYLITTQLKGELMTREKWLTLARRDQLPVLAELATGLRELHLSESTGIDFDWDKFIAGQAATCFERQKACSVNERVLAEIPGYLEEHLRLLPTGADPVFLHGDVHFGNLRLSKEGGRWRISGLFDFADSLKGFYEYEFLAVGVLMIQGQGALQREFFRACGYRDDEINEELRKRLMLLTMFYECSDLRRYAIRLRAEAVDYSLLELERAIWNF
jgi:hygromycin-B 7''-O-kinase